MNTIFEMIFKRFFQNQNESIENDEKVIQDFFCAYCKKKNTNGYRYTCLECHDYELCNDCFYRRKSNQSHKTGHKVLRFNSASNCLFGVEYKKYELYLENLKNKFENEIHLDIKCNNCNQEHIKGLRYKCSCCYDFNLCENCSKKASGKHFLWHPLITYCKSVKSLINYSDIELKELLGRGGFGKVHKAIYKGQTVACKIIQAREIVGNYQLKIKSYKRELDGFKEIIGDNILKMIGYCTQKITGGENFIILSEFMKHGSLADLIITKRDLSYKERLTIATGIAKGMELIHRIGFVHRDIRPDNILISFDYTPKIGDMGISKMYEEKMKNTVGIGCRFYMPPEFYADKCTQKLDVYTFGLTLNELFLGKHDQYNQKIVIIQEGQLIYRTLISSYIHSDPNRRPNSKEITEMLTFIDSYTHDKLNTEKYTKASLSKRNQIYKDLYNQSLDEYEKKKATENDEIKKLQTQKKQEFYSKKLNFQELINNNEEDSMVPAILEKISRLYWTENDVDNAISYAKKAIEKMIEIVGNEDDEQILYYKRYLALVYLKLADKPQEAIEIYQHVLTKIEKPDLENSNPHIPNVYYRIGECYEKLNQVEIALDHHLKCLRLRRAFYDHNSEYIMESVTQIKEIYSKLNNMDKYFDYRREELRIKRELFKLKHPDKEYFDVMLIRGKDEGRLAWHYILVENEEKYEELMKQKEGNKIDVTKYGKVIESGWGETPSSYISKSIENTYDWDYPKFKSFKIDGIQVDDYFKDENEDFILNDLYSNLKSMYEYHNGENNLQVAKILFDISKYYIDMLQDASNANKFSEKCIQICEKFSSPLSRKLVAEALITIGRSYLNIIKNYPEALKFFEKSLEIRTKVYRNNNPKIGFCHEYIGDAYFEQENYVKALEHFAKCEQIYNIAYENQSNVFFCEILNKIGTTYQKLEQVDKYFDYRREEMKIKKELFKQKHPDREYFDPILIRGKDEGRPAWHYILVENEQKYEELTKQQEGSNLDVTDFGRIIRSGWGANPSDKIVKEINTNYSCYPDYFFI